MRLVTAAAHSDHAVPAAAAAIDGWLGPVDEDGFMLGLDDIAWDQEALLGGSVDGGFGLRFEPNIRLSFGLAPSRSGLGSQVSLGWHSGRGGVWIQGPGRVAY